MRALPIPACPRRPHYGTLEAPDEKSAIEAAAKQFNITPARRNKIVVTKIEEKPASRA
jgi:hypothetical protein